MTTDHSLEAVPPETWAKFASAALQGLVNQIWVEPQTSPIRYEKAADEAALFADALSREFVKRFVYIVSSKLEACR